MHPNDMCKHKNAAVLCTVPGCKEEPFGGAAAEHLRMNPQDELRSAYDNLTATQNRCSDLLEENRALKKQVETMRSRWTSLLTCANAVVNDAMLLDDETEVDMAAMAPYDTVEALRPIFPAAIKAPVCPTPYIKRSKDE